jgi:hypothetical protein
MPGTERNGVHGYMAPRKHDIAPVSREFDPCMHATIARDMSSAAIQNKQINNVIPCTNLSVDGS